MDLDVEARFLRHRLHDLRDTLGIRRRRRHQREAGIRHARFLQQLLRALHVALRDRRALAVEAVAWRDPLVAGHALALHRDLDDRVAIERKLERFAHASVLAERILLREVALADVDRDALVADLDDLRNLEAVVALSGPLRPTARGAR
jgi:hypothetical protein